MKRNRCEKGFTIVEIMIALAVLSVLLVICTIVLINLGRMYTKGKSQATAQDVARNVINDISSDLQLGGATADISDMYDNHGNVRSYGSICIGTTRYSYVIGREVGVGVDDMKHKYPSKHGLWRDTMQNSDCMHTLLNNMLYKANPTDPAVWSGSNNADGNGEELIPGKMRLVKFQIDQVGSGLYHLEVGVAYGDNDLLCVRGANLGHKTDCDSEMINKTANIHSHSVNLRNPGDRVVGCVGGTAQEYCGVSVLSTTVARRLTSE